MLQVLILAGLAAASWWIPARQRALAWLAISIGALYALQTPGTPIDIASLTLGLTLGVWWIIRPAAMQRGDRIVIGMGALIGLGAAAISGGAVTMAAGLCLAALGGTAINSVIPLEADSQSGTRKRLAALGIFGVVSLLILVKTPVPVALMRAASLPIPAALPGLSAFGFSYIAFRLVHSLIDYRNGRLPPLALSDFALYILFFPALTAGPIDRVSHFMTQASTETVAERPYDTRHLIAGGKRIAWGLVKKFIIADSLSYFAMGPTLVTAMQQTGGSHPLALWLGLYAYALYIYFDFSGYTDIAIGIALVMGVRLPENFQQPYLSPNISVFWNRWHITLSGWYRDYVFTPLSRGLLRRKVPGMAAALAAQIGTMVLIGLWHGVSLNFVLWGLWHAFGLFIHQRVLARIQWPEGVMRWRYFGRTQRIVNTLATFHFVAIGWVFFAIPDLRAELHVLSGLLGVGVGR